MTRGDLARSLPIVWLLLQPPVSGGTVRTGAPIGSWIVNGRFPTSEACESTRRKNLAALAYAESTGASAEAISKRGVITAARCVSDAELRAMLSPSSPTPTPA